MFENLQIFQMASAMARHAGARQAVLARNMANADTPGYQARDIAPFAESYTGANRGTGGFGMKATRAAHISEISGGHAVQVRDRAAATSDPNGNSVSLEDEMLRASQVKRQHGRALAIYKSSLTILRAASGHR